MNRSRLLNRLEAAWQDLKASYAGLSEALMLQPGVTGTWAIKDIVAHVTTWEEEALKHLPTIAEGRRPPRYSVLHGGIHAFNAKTTAAKAALPLAEVLRLSEQVHRQLVELIERAPEDQLASETRFRRRLRADTYGHYPLHAEAIRRWRSRAPAEGGARPPQEGRTR